MSLWGPCLSNHPVCSIPLYPLPCREGLSLKLPLSLLFLLLHHAAWIIRHAQSRPFYMDPELRFSGFHSKLSYLLSHLLGGEYPSPRNWGRENFPLTQKIWLLFLFSITVDQGPMLRPVPKRKIPCWTKLCSPNLYLLKPSLPCDYLETELIRKWQRLKDIIRAGSSLDRTGVLSRSGLRVHLRSIIFT